MVILMKKNIKLILLVILIVSMLITVILFVNFAKKNNVSNNGYVENNKDDILKDFYNVNLYFANMTISGGNEELFRTDYRDGKYLVISKQSVEYCYDKEKECKIDNYVYQNNMISISTKNTIGAGDYTIELIDDKLKLSRKENGKTISYYFEEAKG